MNKFTVAIINDNYKFRLQPSHHQALCIRSITGNNVLVVYNQIQMIFVQDAGINCKGICDCYTW